VLLFLRDDLLEREPRGNAPELEVLLAVTEKAWSLGDPLIIKQLEKALNLLICVEWRAALNIATKASQTLKLSRLYFFVSRLGVV